ncbi:MAG: hypothetical protein R3A45_08885 [Bdellovibrionota bacterium]
MSQKKALKIEGPIRPAHLEHGPRIDITRLEKDIIELGSIGKRPSDGGVYRMAFSDADVQARKWLLGKIEGIGLKASMDYALNVFGLDDRAGTRSSLFDWFSSRFGTLVRCVRRRFRRYGRS